MNHIDQDKLLNELLAPDEALDLRRRSLEQGLNALRRDRSNRRALRTAALVCLPALLVAVIITGRPHVPAQAARLSARPPTFVSQPPTNNSQIKLISAEELFALFSGSSLAVVGKPGHQP